MVKLNVKGYTLVTLCMLGQTALRNSVVPYQNATTDWCLVCLPINSVILDKLTGSKKVIFEFEEYGKKLKVFQFLGLLWLLHRYV